MSGRRSQQRGRHATDGRHFNHGDLAASGSVRMVALAADDPDVVRFMRMVDILPCGCWFFTGARSRGRGNRKWYGSFYYRGKTIRAHVFSCDKIGGKIVPRGWHRGHSCHFSLCVNPEHIDPMSPSDNQKEKVERALLRRVSGASFRVSEEG